MFRSFGGPAGVAAGTFRGENRWTAAQDLRTKKDAEPHPLLSRPPRRTVRQSRPAPPSGRGTNDCSLLIKSLAAQVGGLIGEQARCSRIVPDIWFRLSGRSGFRSCKIACSNDSSRPEHTVSIATKSEAATIDWLSPGQCFLTPKNRCRALSQRNGFARREIGIYPWTSTHN